MDFLRKFLLNLINSVNGSDRIEVFFAFMMTGVFFYDQKELLLLRADRNVASNDAGRRFQGYKVFAGRVEAAGKRTGAV